MIRSRALAFIVVASFCTQGGYARAQDAGAARQLLVEGVDLRKRGEWAQAIARLTESARLDLQPRTLINLADCEEHVGKLIEAQKHWVSARDLSVDAKQKGIEAEAVSRLAALEPRIPKLAIVPPSIEGVRVFRDDVELAAISWSRALPINPGEHTVRLVVAKHDDSRVTLTLAEGESKTLELHAGAARTSAGPAPAAPKGTEEAPHSMLRPAALVVGGVGIASVVVGSYFGLSANSKWNDAQKNDCHGTVCNAAGVSLVHDAQSSATLGTIFFVSGVALVGAGAVMWLVAPDNASKRAYGATPGVAATWRVSPTWLPAGGGLVATGAFQ